MKRKVLLIVLAISLGCAWVSTGAAGQITYSLKSSETGFVSKPQTGGPPSSAVMAADALLGRPLGAATTIAGTAVFIAAIPLTLATDTTGEAAWGLVGRPGAWTFVRPLGRGNRDFEEQGVFKP